MSKNERGPFGITPATSLGEARFGLAEDAPLLLKATVLAPLSRVLSMKDEG